MSLDVSNSKQLRETFLSPPAEFGPVPLWFWNDTMDREEVLRQIRDFHDKRIAGFVLHPRIGMTREFGYMSDKYLDLVEAAVAQADKLGMIVYLYDEASYPSGSAHGMVVQDDPEYASRGISMVRYPCGGRKDLDVGMVLSDEGEAARLVSIQAVRHISSGAIDPEATIILRSENGKVHYSAPVGEDWSVMLFVDVPSDGKIRGLHPDEEDWGPRALPSGDLLNPDAVRTFIRVTYEKYYQRLSAYFGKTIRAVFTDEPNILGRRHRPGLMPWTGGFLGEYLAQGGRETDLPLLWFPGGEQARKRTGFFNRAVQHRLGRTYYGQLAEWCGKHGVALTGHPGLSEEIGLLEHFHIPSQDLVWRWVAPENGLALTGSDSTMGKCTSDAARHSGKRRNGNECFGCCYRHTAAKNTYDLPAEDIKWYLDWLFVRGVNLIMPHAFYYSIRGEERLNERPPDVGIHNIWWPYYWIFSDYVRRMSWLLTDCVNQAEVAVLCGENVLPWEIVKSLYENQIEFNYLESRLLASPRCTVAEGRIRIEAQSYSVVLVENLEWIEEAKEKLAAFIAQGGKVISLRGIESICPKGVISIGSASEASRAVMEHLEPDVVSDPHSNDLRVTHVTRGGMHFYLLVNEGEGPIECTLRLNAAGEAERWDALEGTVHPIEALARDDANTLVPLMLARRESAVIRINPVIPCPEIAEKDRKEKNDNRNPAGQKEKIIILNKGWIASAAGREMELDALGSWTLWEGMQDFSGTVTYRNTLLLEETDGLRVKVDLGGIEEIAHLYVNGCDAGAKLWGPFVFDISDRVRHGGNTIEVRITNSLANRYNHAQLPSGLLGPCRIVLQYGRIPERCSSG